MPVSMPSTSPTKPRSGASGSSSAGGIGRAWMNRPSCPSMPTARPPWRLMSDTSSWLSSDSAISTIVSARSSVTRCPRWRRMSSPIVRISSSMRQPPPCTTIGFIPTSRSSATSRAKVALSSGSAIARPPKRTTIVLPW